MNISISFANTLFRIFLVAFIALAITEVSSGAVQAEGRAPGDVANAREQALADALREAVRIGAGVDLVSSTQVKDFALDYDRIFSMAFGHVRDYKVLESGLKPDGLYLVRISAEVTKGAPDVRDELVLREFVRRRGSPRVALRIVQSVDSLEDQSVAAAWFEETCRKFQLQLVSEDQAASVDSALAKRDAVLGRGRDASLRGADLRVNADYLLEASVRGRYLGQESLYGSLPEHRFSLSAEMKLIDPTTGAVVVATVLPGAENLNSGLASKSQAAREIMFKYLGGPERGKKAGQKDADEFFRKLLTHWVAELDLGRVFRVDLMRAPLSTLQDFESSLRNDERVSAVWRREFDAEAVSALDVETRLSSADLATLCDKAAHGTARVEKTFGHRIQMQAGRATTDADANGKGFSTKAIVLFGSGALALVILIAKVKFRKRHA